MDGWFIMFYHLEYPSPPMKECCLLTAPKKEEKKKKKNCKHSSESIELSNDSLLSVNVIGKMVKYRKTNKLKITHLILMRTPHSSWKRGFSNFKERTITTIYLNP